MCTIKNISQSWVLSVSSTGCYDSKQAAGELLWSNNPLGLNLDYSAANFLVPHDDTAHQDAETQLFVVNDEPVPAHNLDEK